MKLARGTLRVLLLALAKDDLLTCLDMLSHSLCHLGREERGRESEMRVAALFYDAHTVKFSKHFASRSLTSVELRFNV